MMADLKTTASSYSLFSLSSILLLFLVSPHPSPPFQLWTIKNSECAGSFDLHDAKIWALATASNGARVLTGAADGRILFLEDVTELEEIEEAGKREKKILQDQNLANCLQQKV